MVAARAPWSLKPERRRWVRSSMSCGCQALRATRMQELAARGGARRDQLGWAASPPPSPFPREDVNPLPSAEKEQPQIAYSTRSDPAQGGRSPGSTGRARNSSHQNTPLGRCRCSWKRDERREMPLGRGGPWPCPAPSVTCLPSGLPGSPVARLAYTNSRHRVAAPRNALRAEELASIAEGAHGAGAVATAKTESKASAHGTPELGLL